MSDELDAYSAIVTRVAAHLTERVASLRVSYRTRGEGGGSAVVFTDDGFLLTNAHVVGSATSGQVAFADGTSMPFRVTGADALSDLAIVRAAGTTPPPVTLGDADTLSWGSSWSPSATRSGSPAR